MKLVTRVGKTAAAAAISTSLALAMVVDTAAAQDRVRWKMPTAFAPNLPGLGSPSGWVPEQLKVMTDGNIEIRVSEAGKLVPTFDILEAVNDGKVPAGYTWIGYDQGVVPAIPLFAAVPFGMKPWAFTAWYYFHGGHEMLQEVYANKGFDVHAELCGIIGPETAGWYSKPIETLDDYKGLKIRFAGLGGKVLEKLGASVTMMPGGELFQALETGTLDATEFSLPVIDQILGFDKVVKYNLFPGWHQTFTAQYMLINNEEWEGLAETQQRTIKVACMAGTTYGLADSEAKNGEVLAKFQERGVKTNQIPVKVLRQLKDVTNEVMEEEASKDEDFKRVYESQQKFMETYKLWDERAYLPSDL